MIKFALLPAAALLQVAAPVPVAGTTEVPVAHSLDGSWTGGITVPAGITIPMDLTINGQAGTFSAPDQKVAAIPTRVVRNGDAVTVELSSSGGNFFGTISGDGQRLNGTWSQGSRAFPANFVRGSRVMVIRSQTPRLPLPYEVREIRVSGGSAAVLLGASLARPRQTAPAPAILLLGGNGPQDRDETHAGHRPMLLIADVLARSGVATLRYDKRGVGSSTGRYAVERPDTDLIADARAALDELRRQPGIDRKRTCVLGLSEGAIIAARLATLEPMQCVILLSPPGLRGPELIAEQKRLAALDRGVSQADANREAELVLAMLAARVAGNEREKLERLAITAGRSPAAAEALASEMLSPEIAGFLYGDPVDALRKIRAPVLVVAGTLDRQVPPDRNLPPIRQALAQNQRARLVVLQGLNHVLQPARFGTVAEYAQNETTISDAALHEVVRFARASLRPGR